MVRVCLEVRLSIAVLAVRVVEFLLFLTSCYHRKKLQDDRKLLSLNIWQLEDSLCLQSTFCIVCVHVSVRKTCKQKIWNRNEQNMFINFVLYYCIKIVLDYKIRWSCQIKRFILNQLTTTRGQKKHKCFLQLW